jgi:hypothetical protein
MNQRLLHIITPVKDSLETTLQTIESIMNSDFKSNFQYTVYNDFSSDETTEKLEIVSAEKGFSLVNLKDITTHPSPNYLLVLQMAQQSALSDGAHLLIVESDVVVKQNTIQVLFDAAAELENPGLIAAVTHDRDGNVNFPYLYAKKFVGETVKTSKRLSFCCTLITHSLLETFDFKNLHPEKSWYDVFISHKAVELGFSNYLMTQLPVLHLPHSSRPWKQLKYTHPLKYYWLKYTKRRDKI